MKHQDYPPLYVAADRLAKRYQKLYLGAVITQGLSLVIIASTGLMLVDRQVYLFVSGVFLLLVAVALFLIVVRPDQVWYGARAVAESVKTMTWRYMCCAPPFAGNRASADQLLVDRLRDVLRENSLVSGRLEAAGVSSSITKAMADIRVSSVAKKNAFYVEYRIENQCEWYTNKSKSARRQGMWAYIILIAVCLAGFWLTFTSLAPTNPSGGVAALGLITTLAAFLMTWIQVKRYSELSAAYAVSSHEIALLVPAAQKSMSQREFGEFVTEAENAFSREHTQWTARRDT